MPRIYKCRKCGVSHQSPTGKQCQRQRFEEADEAAASVTDVMPLLLELKEQMQNASRSMAEQLQTVNQRLDSVVAGGSVADDGATGGHDIDSDEELEQIPDQANAVSLCQDMQLMSRAARRLARLRLDDSDDEEVEALDRTRNAGKKSGSVMTATDTVRKPIDWPHLYITRMNGGKQRNVTYSELQIDEFVYGFLCMLDAPNCKWDFRTMIAILKNLMQDSMEFTWASAASFYRMAGVAVEKKQLQWSDRELLHVMRMTYARTIFPNVRESREQTTATPKTQLQMAPAGMRCCVPYQRHTCEQEGDHVPFTHSCAYCFRAKSALCRHPESDCKRKAFDTKNGKARED